MTAQRCEGAKASWLARRLLVALTALLAPAVHESKAQELPSRTIRMVVAFPAGGPADFVARLLADKLKTLIGQGVIVENRAGANGAIGAEYVARADSDGATLFFTTVGAVAITPHLMARVPYDPIRDFAPITLVVRNTTILLVKPDMTAASAKELAAPRIAEAINQQDKHTRVQAVERVKREIREQLAAEFLVAREPASV